MNSTLNPLPRHWQDCHTLLHPACRPTLHSLQDSSAKHDALARCTLGQLAGQWCRRYLPSLAQQTQGMLRDDQGWAFYHNDQSWQNLSVVCNPDMEFDVEIDRVDQDFVQVTVQPDSLTASMPELYCPVMFDDRLKLSSFHWIGHDDEVVDFAQYALHSLLPAAALHTDVAQCCRLHFTLGHCVHVPLQ